MDDLLFEGEIEGLRIQRKIGSGGSGTAYLVHNTRIDRQECMKVFDPVTTSDSSQPWSEARRAGNTGVPGVVTVFSAGTIKDRSWFTMEYSPFGDLRRVVTRSTLAGISFVERATFVMSLLKDVASTIDALHSLESPLIHGDIKPENILVFARHNGDFQAKLADFGLATSYAPAGDEPTATTLISGTLPYLAPERFRGSPASPEADLYAFACTVFEILSGQRAFSGGHLPRKSDTLTKIHHYRTLHSSPKRPVSGNIEASLSVCDDIFESALAIDPGSRYPSAVEFCDALIERLGVSGELRDWAASGPANGDVPAQLQANLPLGSAIDSGVDQSVFAGTTGFPTRQRTQNIQPSKKRTIISVVGAIALAAVVIPLIFFMLPGDRPSNAAPELASSQSESGQGGEQREMTSDVPNGDIDAGTDFAEESMDHVKSLVGHPSGLYECALMESQADFMDLGYLQSFNVVPNPAGLYLPDTCEIVTTGGVRIAIESGETQDAPDSGIFSPSAWAGWVVFNGVEFINGSLHNQKGYYFNSNGQYSHKYGYLTVQATMGPDVEYREVENEIGEILTFLSAHTP